MTVKLIQSREQFEELLKSSKPIVIDFWAPWCRPCKAISPVYEKISNEIECLEFASVNVEDKQFGLETQGIRAMPTFQIIENGLKVAELVGADPSKLRVSQP
ncbi:thioredoxin-like protein [Phakopsora pachyrhizi]|nr:thioredoxin-like protein [Phakopsora pachyrhizi]